MAEYLFQNKVSVIEQSMFDNGHLGFKSRFFPEHPHESGYGIISEHKVFDNEHLVFAVLL